MDDDMITLSQEFRVMEHKKKKTLTSDERRQRSQKNREKQTILQDFQRIYAGQIDADVVKMILEDNEYDEDKALSELSLMAPPPVDPFTQLRLEDIPKELLDEVMPGKTQSDLKSQPDIPANSSLQFLDQMFPELGMDMIEIIWKENGEDLKKTVDFLLPLSEFEGDGDNHHLEELPPDHPQENPEELPAHSLERIMYEQLVQKNSPDTNKNRWAPFVSKWKRPKPTYSDMSKHSKDEVATSEDTGPSSKNLGDFNYTADEEVEKKIRSIAEMFPTIRTSEIACRLEENEDDADVTVEFILKNIQALEAPQVRAAPLKGQWNSKLAGTTEEKLDFSSKLKIKSLMAKFDWVDEDLLQGIFLLNGANISKTLANLDDIFRVQFVSAKPAPVMEPEVPDVPEISDVRPKFPKKEKKPRGEGGFVLVTSKKKPAKKLENREPDEDHSHYAALRNECYRQAALAFAAGNRASALELTTQGKQHERKMRVLYQKSLEKQFDRSRDDPIVTADLHGMLVRESLDIVETLLDDASKNSATRILKIITGAGKHSIGGKARIRPAVINLLRELGVRFNEPKMGVLVVQVRN
eukprot:TRINITY_DN9557_c0_g1_i1.p1 TRINITY_DN9557_c0_g1~~TRINITY_DN9557_c0_g1_i1.p1  ORF type:complete len:582 (-),score=141.62 TRINITY_DN9557_c0_g1_i1:37-1782(-)